MINNNLLFSVQAMNTRSPGALALAAQSVEVFFVLLLIVSLVAVVKVTFIFLKNESYDIVRLFIAPPKFRLNNLYTIIIRWKKKDFFLHQLKFTKCTIIWPKSDSIAYPSTDRKWINVLLLIFLVKASQIEP